MKKLLAIFLIAALALSLLTACNSASASSSDPAAPAAANSAAQPEPEPEPEPEPPYDPAVLTGLPKDENYPEGQRITAIMVNNISNTPYQEARPQNGLSDADILIEIKVEGGITRFCALYTDYRNLPEICPVRSARDQFFQLILPFQPIYIHDGESTVQSWYKRDYEYDAMDIYLGKYAGDSGRDQNRGNVAREHTEYVDGEHIQSAIDSRNTDTRRTYTSTFFDFVNYNEPNRVLKGDDATGIKIVHSQSYRTYFDWDAASGKYLMSQYSLRHGDIRPAIDANNDQQLAFENVLVLFADFSVYPDPGQSGYDLQKVDYTYGGVGYYFSGGKAEFIRWKKGAPLEALYILDGDGNETSVKINPGKTYIAVLDLVYLLPNGKSAVQESYYVSTGTAQTDTAETVGEDNATANFVEND